MMASFHKSSFGWVEVKSAFLLWMMMLSHIEWVSHVEVHVSYKYEDGPSSTAVQV